VVRQPLILKSARKHQAEQGFTDQDILDAWANPLGVVTGRGDMSLVIGMDSQGRLLEIGLMDAIDYPPPIVHAMLARKTYVDKLRRKGR
jgi:hypothetical protein